MLGLRLLKHPTHVAEVRASPERSPTARRKREGPSRNIQRLLLLSRANRPSPCCAKSSPSPAGSPTARLSGGLAHNSPAPFAISFELQIKPRPMLLSTRASFKRSLTARSKERLDCNSLGPSDFRRDLVHAADVAQSTCFPNRSPMARKIGTDCPK